MKLEFIKHLKPIAAEVLKSNNSSRGHALITSIDKDLLFLFAEVFTKMKKYTPIYIENENIKDNKPDKKIFFINLKEKTHIEYQSLLYYYLEISKTYDCFVCLFSTSARCLEFLEKRVRSRFTNRIFFIPYLYNEKSNFENNEKSNFENNEKLNTINKIKTKNMIKNAVSLEKKKVQNFILKYELDKFNLNFIFELLDPIHFALLILAENNKINYKNVQEVFRKRMIEIKALRGVENNKILRSYYDLLEFRLITETGYAIIDFSELKNYIYTYEPKYLQNMIKFN